MYIPPIPQGNLETFLEELEKEEIIPEKIITEIGHSNPHLLDLIASTDCMSFEGHRAYMKGALTVYELLRRTMEMPLISREDITEFFKTKYNVSCGFCDFYQGIINRMCGENEPLGKFLDELLKKEHSSKEKFFYAVGFSTFYELVKRI
jgi:hypothetical protein